MNGLIQARGLRQAADLGRADRLRAVGAFLNAWRAEIAEHFDDEERLLLPLVRSPALRDRLLEEHGVLRRLAAQCERDPDGVATDAGLVRFIGDRLHDHIRWEEREFFEAVQRDDPEGLATLVPEAAFIEERRAGSRTRRGASTGEGEGGTDEP